MKKNKSKKADIWQIIFIISLVVLLPNLSCLVPNAIPKILSNVKDNKEMQLLRENNVELEYVYRDKNSQEIFRIVIQPDDYKN